MKNAAIQASLRFAVKNSERMIFLERLIPVEKCGQIRVPDEVREQIGVLPKSEYYAKKDENSGEITLTVITPCCAKCGTPRGLLTVHGATYCASCYDAMLSEEKNRLRPDGLDRLMLEDFVNEEQWFQIKEVNAAAKSVTLIPAEPNCQQCGTRESVKEIAPQTYLCVGCLLKNALEKQNEEGRQYT